MLAESLKLALSQRTCHYPKVDLGKHWNECGHDRQSWHDLGVPFTIRGWIWTNIGKVDIMQVWNWSIFAQRGHYRGWIWAKIEQSGHYRKWIWTKIGQSGHRGQNRAKWALSGVDAVQGWIWTHYRRVKMNDSLIPSTKSTDQVGNSQSQGE